jgi:hypothetical protein
MALDYKTNKPDLLYDHNNIAYIMMCWKTDKGNWQYLMVEIKWQLEGDIWRQSLQLLEEYWNSAAVQIKARKQ